MQNPVCKFQQFSYAVGMREMKNSSTINDWFLRTPLLRSTFLMLGVSICVFVASCTTVPADTTLQSQAYELYGKAVLAFQESSYTKREQFYREAYQRIDLMEMRARVDTSRAFDATGRLTKLQKGFITPIEELRTVIQLTEKMDKRGSLSNPNNLQAQTDAINQMFYNVIYRQTTGGE